MPYTVIGRNNETDQEVLQIIWDIPFFFSPITEHYEWGKQLESWIGMFQVICKTAWYVSFFLPIPVQYIPTPCVPVYSPGDRFAAPVDQYTVHAAEQEPVPHRLQQYRLVRLVYSPGVQAHHAT